MKLQVIQRAVLGLALCASAVSCVNVDPETNQVIPRGNQRYEFDRVVENVDRLEVGLNKLQVVMLLGSPAEESDHGDTWVYLPERPAVIVPGRALKLEFRNGKLTEYGFHAIVLGARL